MRALAGTTTLARLALRRDRVRLALWVVALVGTVVGTASSLSSLYPTLAERQELAASVAANSAVVALTGPTFDLSTVGGLTAWRTGGLAATLAGLMNPLTVIRHTRAEEESGRSELVGSGAVGRLAPLAAGLAVALVADLALALGVALGLAGLGLPASGSVALGLSIAATGAVFAAVGAMAAQLATTARAAGGLAGAVLGVSYLLRAAGDAAGDGGVSWLSWLSPIGWAQQVRPFAGERWWMLAVSAGVMAVLVALAAMVVRRRDLGAGVLAPRVGPAGAGANLSGPFGLAWRLQRSTLGAWAMGLGLAGLAVGSVAGGVGDLVGDNQAMRDLLARMGGTERVVDAYLASSLGLLALVAAAGAVQAVLRLRAEEVGERAEPVLAAITSRHRWVLSHVVVAAGGSVAALAVAGLSMGLAHGLGAGDVGAQVVRVTETALAQVPAVWVLAALTVAVFGLVPRAVVLAWGALAGCVVISQLGPVLELDQWVLDLSPFSHVPLTLGAGPSQSLLVLMAVSAALAGAGLAGFRRRDVG